MSQVVVDRLTMVPWHKKKKEKQERKNKKKKQEKEKERKIKEKVAGESKNKKRSNLITNVMAGNRILAENGGKVLRGSGM